MTSTTGPTRREPLRRNALYGLLSQAANSGGNMVLTVFVARHSSQTSYGAWALGYAAFMMALAMARSLASTPMLLGRYTAPDQLRRAASAAVCLSLGAGVLAGGTILAFGAVTPRVFEAGLAFAVLMPALLAQDALRYVCFTRESPGDAALMDASWLVIEVGLFVLLEASHHTGSSAVTVAWGLALAPGAVWVMFRRQVAPRLSAVPEFWRNARSDAMKLLADAGIASATTQALPVLVATGAGLEAAGALRGGLTLMGGINIIVAGLTPVATLAARREHDRTGRVVRFMWEWSVVILVISSVNGAMILALPDHVGRQILGATWPAAVALTVPLVLQSMIRGPLTGAPLALRASARVGLALRLRMWTTVPAFVFPWGGALGWGVMGAVWGILVSAVAGNLICLWTLRRAPQPSPRVEATPS